jgi:hypothetical protein
MCVQGAMLVHSATCRGNHCEFLGDRLAHHDGYCIHPYCYPLLEYVWIAGLCAGSDQALVEVAEE